MTIFHVTEATGGLPNSGRLSGTDGDLVGIMDVAAPLNSWTIPFSSGTDHVYRAASGNRFVLTMRDAAAISGAANYATVRGAESASGASTYTDTFATTAELADANSNWIKSSVATSTARNFDIYVAATFIIYCVNYDGTANHWDTHFFGDVAAAFSGDSYNTWHCARVNQTAATQALGSCIATSAGSNSARAWFVRSYDGTVKSSSSAAVGYLTNTIFGVNVNFPPPKAGPTTGIDRQKVILMDNGSTTTALSATKGMAVRAYLPNIWQTLHGSAGGVLNTRDTFTDTAYNAAATFRVFYNANGGNSCIIIEETDTWSPPGI